MRLALGPLEPLLALNVEKEVRKDALVIGSGQLPLAQARDIDREFLAQLDRLPLLRLEIRYRDVEPIRRERMQRLLDASRRLLAPPWRGMRAAVRAAYERAAFEAALVEHLRLYAAEVHALGGSVRPRLLLAPLRARLRRVMEEQADALAREVSDLIYDTAMR